MLGIDSELMFLLDTARGNANIPFIITSGLRTPAQSVAVGGYVNDPHTKGLAVDILCLNDTDQLSIVFGAKMAGFKRIGLGKSHVHLDIDSSLPQNVLFIENQ